MKLNAWIEALSPADKALLADALNKDPVTALETYKALAGSEALEVLRELFDIRPLGDAIYDVRARVGTAPSLRGGLRRWHGRKHSLRRNYEDFVLL